MQSRKLWVLSLLLVATVFASQFSAAEGPKYSQSMKLRVQVVKDYECPHFDFDFHVALINPANGFRMCIARVQWGEIRDAISPFVGSSVDIEARIAMQDDPENQTHKNLALISKVSSRKIKYPGSTDRINSMLIGLGTGMAAVSQASVGASTPNDNQQSSIAQQSPSQPQPSDTGVPAGSYVPSLNSCVTSFYGPMPTAGGQWFHIRNGCSQNIFVSWHRIAGGGGGASDIPAGGETGTGDTLNMMRKFGDYKFYACPEHSSPMDLNDKYVSGPVAEFRCKAHKF